MPVSSRAGKSAPKAVKALTGATFFTALAGADLAGEILGAEAFFGALAGAGLVMALTAFGADFPARDETGTWFLYA